MSGPERLCVLPHQVCCLYSMAGPLPDGKCGPILAAERLARVNADLLAALTGLRYRPDMTEPQPQPDRYCDHAAEPCPRCEAARAAIAEAGRKP